MTPVSLAALVDTSAYFALMARLGLTTAFAFDLHFRQYGRLIVVP